MIQPASFSRTALLLSLLSPLAACGDSSPTGKSKGDAGPDGDGTAMDAGTSGDGDGTGDGDGDDSAMPGKKPDGGGLETDGGGDGDGDGPAPLRTATITLGAQSWTVVPHVGRGLSASPSPTYHAVMAERDAGGQAMLSCSPSASPLQGGRTIQILDYLLVSGAAYHCSGGGYTDAQHAVRSAARNACNGRTSCTVPAFDAFLGGIWGCQGTAPSAITLEYTCSTLPSVAPAMQFEHEGEVTVKLTALDGPGSATCAERGAGIEIEGYVVDEDAPCTIDLTTRTGSDLAGVVSMTLIDENEERHPFSIDFHHERNRLKPTLVQANASTFCLSNAVSHRTRVDGNDIVDTLRAAAPFNCEPALPDGAAEPKTVEIDIRRPNATEATAPQSSFRCDAGGRVTVRIDGKSTVEGACATMLLDEEPHALRAVLHSLYLCDGADCVSPDTTMLLNYDFSNLVP